jgi:uncharacterized protein involved in exopolysaccharide biosynthesis
MEDAIDLREYIEVLFRHWRWIACLGLVAAITALAISLFLPRTYRVSSVILVTEPRYQMGFDPRFMTEERTPAYKAFPSLATSDDVLHSVVGSYTPSPEAKIGNWGLAALSGMIEASSRGDPSLVVLTVTSHSAQDAVGIANQWADVLVRHGNEIYGESELDVVFFEEQVSQAEEAADRAEAAMIEFQARNLAGIVDTQLASLRKTQADYLADQREISYITQDIVGLREQLTEQPEDQPVTLADSLTALLLQIKAFNAQASVPVEFQVGDGQTLSDRSTSEQTAFLDDLVVTLQAKSVLIDERLTELEPQILGLQEQLQKLNSEKERLTRTQQLSWETYVTLARKLEEVRIAAQEENGVLQVGSYAAVPQDPISPRKLLMVAVAGLLGLGVGALAAFAIEARSRYGTKVGVLNDSGAE